MNVKPPLLDKISDYVDYHSDINPESIAFIYNNERISYRQCKYKVDDITKAMIAAGIKKGDRVATLSTPTPDFFTIFLACASIGAIWIGYNPRHTRDELCYFTEDCRPKLIFSRTSIQSRELIHDLSYIREHNSDLLDIISLDQFSNEHISLFNTFIENGTDTEDKILNNYRKKVKAKDTATIIYTSGTTGKPKGAMLTHLGLCKVFRNQITYFTVDPLRLINFSPINHIGSLGDISCYCLIAGGTNIFLEKFDTYKVLKLMEEEKVTLWFGVPTTAQLCLQHSEFSTFDLSALQLIAFGGAPPPINLLSQLSKFDLPFCNTYGQTETTSSVTYAGPTENIDTIHYTVGKPVPEYQVRIIASENQIAKVNEVGEIQVKGDFIMSGYWNNEIETRKTFAKENWLRTGDLGQFNEQGELILCGRIKEMFKSGGYNVYPIEIEEAISKHHFIQDTTVVSVKDDLFGEVGYAFFVCNEDSIIGSDELENYCRKHLANYKIPKKFIPIDELPMLPIGKIDRTQLKKMAFEIHNSKTQ